VGGNAYGARLDKGGEARLNSVLVKEGGNIRGNVFGTSSIEGDVHIMESKVEVRGKVLGEMICGGRSEKGIVEGSEIDIYDTANISSVVLVGGGAREARNNELRIHGKGIEAYGVNGFDRYTFFLSDEIEEGESVLRLSMSRKGKLNEDVDIDFSGNIDMGVEVGGGSKLGRGKRVILMEDERKRGLEGEEVYRKEVDTVLGKGKISCIGSGMDRIYRCVFELLGGREEKQEGI
jgi:hypothetical protein